MDRSFSQKNLLLVLGVLVTVKFMLLPLLEWQHLELQELKAKIYKLQKMDHIIENAPKNEEQLRELAAKIDTLSPYFYSNSDKVKLEIQDDIEKIFSSNNVAIERFSWISGASISEEIVPLRVLVGFMGETRDVFRALILISNHSRVSKHVEWRNRITGDADNYLGRSRGHITLEFYARDHSLRYISNSTDPAAKSEDDA